MGYPVYGQTGCAMQYDYAQANGCLGAPTSSCAAPNACMNRTGGNSKFNCDAISNFTNEAYAVKQGVQAVFLQNWPLANCSGQPYPASTTKVLTNKCVVTGEATSFMTMKEERSAVAPVGTVIQPTYTAVSYSNRYCISGAENPYGRPSNWAERFQNIGNNETYAFDDLATIGGVSGTCNAKYDNNTRPDYPGSPRPWTLYSASFISLAQPSGLNVGAFLTDYDDGDVYSTTKTYTVENGACYDDIMYTGCATSKSPMVVSVRNGRWPYVPGCNGTEFDHQYSVLGADGCETGTLSGPDNVKQMYTECSTSGNQITWKIQAYSDAYCEHVNDYLNGLVNFENFPGAAGSSGAGWIRSTVTVVTAALLAAVLV